MILVFFPVVFVFIEVETVFFFDTKYIIKLEEMSLPLMCRRLSDTDKSATVVYKFFDCCNDRLIDPVFTTALRSVRIADIQHDIKLFQKLRIFTDIIKTDKGYIKRCTTQSFDNTKIGVILFVIDCMVYHMISPGAHFAPAVQNCYFFHTVRGCSLNIII